MHRFRNYRKDRQTRDNHADIKVIPADIIQPCFVVEGRDIKREIRSLPGVFHHSIDRLLRFAEATINRGISTLLIFGVIGNEYKDAQASAATQTDNLVSRAVTAIKKKFPLLTVITDVCICGYTDHGHCGLVNGEQVLNDETLPILARMALTHANAGADMVAPSAMMDGQVAAIRTILDKHNCRATRILSYSVKFASGMYGPFRDAVESSPAFGDRATYQMDYRNTSLILKECRADIEEGADWLMVKPAHTYLDVIHHVKQQFLDIPLAAYHVSGEYAMIKLAAQAGLLDEHKAFHEVLTAIKRAGADHIISYAAEALF